MRVSLTELRARKDQEFDGEAHLTNEELDALLDAVEAAGALEAQMVEDTRTRIFTPAERDFHIALNRFK